MGAWSIRDSEEYYGIHRWGRGFFRMNSRGSVEVVCDERGERALELKSLVGEVRERGIPLPLLLRFDGVLRLRLRQLLRCFATAIAEHEYRGSYTPVYPIKVNQQRHVVETLLDEGRPGGMGLEVGSKPELLAVIPLMEGCSGPLICNGYKDGAYIEIALLASRLGRRSVLVIEKLTEIERVIAVARRLNIRPRLGVRTRLTARGAGRWEASGGDRSKFGLDAAEMVTLIEHLNAAGMIDCLEVLHFHLGSQITSIAHIKNGLKEATRLYVELARMGCGALRTLDVGGGLGVDYEGSRTLGESSMNYSMQEYASDVIWLVQETCDAQGIAHPEIITESGRALVAHHAVLVVDVLGVSRLGGLELSALPRAEEEHEILGNLREASEQVARGSVQEVYHDLIQLRDEALTHFNLGLIDLRTRAQADGIFWAACRRLLERIQRLEHVPEELASLEVELSDTYYCNFSIFQSIPDHWALGQLFPVLPIQDLDRRPDRLAVLGDITCDSDGKIDRFVGARGGMPCLRLHDPSRGDYFLGIFLVGAYQEILGDLHNLFGDSNAVHVEVDEDGRYRLSHVIEGDRVREVLAYVQFDAAELLSGMRRSIEVALGEGLISYQESGRLLRRYAEGLSGSTYLEEL